MTEKYIKASECEKYFYEHLDDLHMIAAMNAIDEMPNEDVAPVKYGYWKQARYTEAPLYICSECDNPEYKQHKYCPNCGTKMSSKNAIRKPRRYVICEH